MNENNSIIGKLPPQSIEEEKCVLGNLMSYPEFFDQISNLLTPDLFYLGKHQLIGRAIINLKAKNKPIDILTVSNELKGNKEVSAYDITILTNHASYPENGVYLTHILFQKYILRTLIKLSTMTIHKAYEAEDSIELLEEADTEFKRLFDMMKTNATKSTDAIFDETVESMKIAAKNDGVIGTSTGLYELNAIIKGLQATFVYLIAARPGMGKSALMKSIAKNCFDNKTALAIFSLEMSGMQLMKGLLSDFADTNNPIIESGKLNEDEWSKVLKYKGTFKNLLFIDDTPAITIQYLETNIRRMVKEHGVKIIMIDYLQLMDLTKNDKFGKNREQEVSFISKNIKRLAKKYSVAIIELSQLSRSVEERKPPRPILSDLRESGSLEQDAEVVIFIYRPAYYKIFTDGQGNDLSTVAELIVAKNRFGPTKSAYVTFVKEKTKFENTAAIPENPFYDSSKHKAFYNSNDEDVF